MTAAGDPAGGRGPEPSPSGPAAGFVDEVATSASRVLGRIPRRWMDPGGEVFFLTLIALAVRLSGWVLRPAILSDSADLLDSAERIRAAGTEALLRTNHHPLPVWALAQVPDGADLEFWGSLGAIVAGSLGVAPLHAIARSAAGRHAATMACLLYAVLPKFVSVSSVPLAEPLFLPLALGAIALALTCGVARTTGARIGRPLLAGTSAALAFLARPEGLVVAGLAAATVGARARRGDRWRAAFLVLLAFALVAGPWVAALSEDAGTFVLSPKKDLLRFAGGEPSPLEAAGRAAGFAAGLRDVGAAFWDALGPACALVLVGVFPLRRWRRKRTRRSRWILLGGAVVLGAILLRLASGWGYAGGRHALTAAALLLPFAGEGLTTLVAFVSRNVRRRRAALALTVLLTVPLGVTAVLRPDGESGEREKLLGEQVAARERERPGTGDVAVASFQEPLVAYYADRALRGEGRRVRNVRLLRDFGPLLTMSADLEGRRADLAARLRESGARWLVLRLWGRDTRSGTPRSPGDDLAARLTADGVLGTPVLASGELVAFPVR